MQNLISSLGPVGNFMYEGDVLGREYYQGLANTKTYRDIFSMPDDAAFDKTLGKIKNPALNRAGYTARGLQSLVKSLVGFSPEVGSVGIGGGTIPGRALYEKVMKNPFAKTLGYGTRAFTGLPGMAIGGLYGLGQQMKPDSALSRFINKNSANYEADKKDYTAMRKSEKLAQEAARAQATQKAVDAARARAIAEQATQKAVLAANKGGGGRNRGNQGGYRDVAGVSRGRNIHG